MTTATVQKWGNSHGLRLSKAFLEECRCVPGTTFRARKVGKNIVLIPVKGIKESKEKKQEIATLEEYVARITPENRHPFLGKGAPVGKEVW